MDCLSTSKAVVETHLRNVCSLRSVCHTGENERNEERILFLLSLWSTLPVLLHSQTRQNTSMGAWMNSVQAMTVLNEGKVSVCSFGVLLKRIDQIPSAQLLGGTRYHRTETSRD